MSMGKNLLTKTSLGKPPNEMGNCPFASPLVAPLIENDDLCCRFIQFIFVNSGK
jgi:hypothetical protein